MTSSGSQDFEQAFRRMKAAVRLCMGLIEAASGDSQSDEKDLWAGVDAIVESASRDVKAIWKRRYATGVNCGGGAGTRIKPARTTCVPTV